MRRPADANHLSMWRWDSKICMLQWLPRKLLLLEKNGSEKLFLFSCPFYQNNWSKFAFCLEGFDGFMKSTQSLNFNCAHKAPSHRLGIWIKIKLALSRVFCVLWWPFLNERKSLGACSAGDFIDFGPVSALWFRWVVGSSENLRVPDFLTFRPRACIKNSKWPPPNTKHARQIKVWSFIHILNILNGCEGSLCARWSLNIEQCFESTPQKLLY